MAVSDWIKSLFGYPTKEQIRQHKEDMKRIEEQHKKAEKAYLECLSAFAKARNQGTITDIYMWCPNYKPSA